MIDESIHIGGSPKIKPSRRNTADSSRFRGQGQILQNSLFIRHISNPFGHTDAQIDNTVWFQFKGRPAGDNLSFIEFHGFEALNGHFGLTAEGRIVMRGESLPVVFRFGNDHTIDQQTRNFDLPRI